MPTLLRFLTYIGIIVGICYAVILLLAYSIEPEPRRMSVSVSSSRLLLKPVAQAEPAVEASTPAPR
ncbi:MAG: hypothetical protein LBR29_02145 [Methylobacteriaceae bacterium]|nr:hypothetical protein [Methylobacteriaceae bacterium]